MNNLVYCGFDVAVKYIIIQEHLDKLRMAHYTSDNVFLQSGRSGSLTARGTSAVALLGDVVFFIKKNKTNELHNE